MNKIRMKKILDIGEVSAQTGLPPATLRFYEEKKLIHSIGRNGLRRLFDHRVLEQLELVALGQYAGFTLAEMIQMFAVKGKFLVDREILHQKADELTLKIKQLTAVRDTLIHVTRCSEPNQLDCPKFQKLLRLAGRKKRVESKKS